MLFYMGRKDFAGVIKLRTLRWGRLSWIVLRPNRITVALRVTEEDVITEAEVRVMRLVAEGVSQGM
jgi:hypothetical protein